MWASWATGEQHGTFLTRPDGPDPAWAGLASRANNFEDRPSLSQRRSPRQDEGSHDAADEVGDIAWDDVVDIVSIGRGPGALAAAVGASRGGLKVFIADVAVGDGGNADADGLSGRLGVTDPDTVEYFASLTEDVVPLTRCADPGQLPMRTVDGLLPAEPGRGLIPTFVGSALRGWADRCLASPYGLLYTDIVRPSMTVTYTSAGAKINAAVIGSIKVVDGQLTQGLDDWLAENADEFDISEPASSALQRLVFDDAGQVVGAVIDTPTGPRAVRARRGVIMETGAAEAAPSWTADGLDNAVSVKVALVTRTASRFARLELLVTPQDR